jgi:hypothetical protein
MKVFLGVILALVVGALVYQLVKTKAPSPELANKLQNMTEQPVSSNAAMHNVTIEEVAQTPSYTYLRVKENNVDYWVATVKSDFAVGDKYSFGEALEMVNFKSKELDKTFDKIYFISENSGMGGGQAPATMAPTTTGRPKVDLKTDVVIEPSKGGISIAELYKNRKNYEGKKVRVKGKVVKVNNEVMDRNWVHIQDGTNDSGSFDLTITTAEFVKIDDVVEFEGTIILNKDFGAGYFYELIMEGGIVSK